MSQSKTKQVTIVMFITVISKCLGFVRDVVLANYFGANNVTDAYFVAQTIPEFLFSIVVQAISIGFIPIYLDVVHNKSKKEADEFSDNVTKLSLILACLLVVIVNLIPRPIVSLFATGFDEETAILAVSFVRIVVLAMLFRIMVAVYNAFLHANNHFVITSFNGIILDVIVIVSIVVAFYTKKIILAWGIVFASFAQFLLLTPAVIKNKSRFHFSFKNLFGKDIKKLLIVVLPVALGIAANQINVLADRTMASSIEGGISALNYANKIDNVLENVIILSLATIMFPQFSKYAADNDNDNLHKSIVKSLNVSTVTMMPCMCFCFLFSKEIIQILFGRGAFDAVAIDKSSIAMMYYSVGVLFISYTAILSRGFYALKKTKTVSLVTCCTVAVNIAMNFLLKPLLGIGGLALATSISNFIGCAILFLCLKKELKKDVFVSTLKETIKCSISCVGLIASSFGVYYFVRPFMNYFPAMMISCAIGGMLYLVAELLLRSSTVFDVLKRFKMNKFLNIEK